MAGPRDEAKDGAMSAMSFKGYVAWVEYDDDDGLFFGRVNSLKNVMARLVRATHDLQADEAGLSGAAAFHPRSSRS